MDSVLSNAGKFFRTLNAGKIIFVLLFFAILFANTLHEEYPDEYDNILGGKYIVHGILPYSGFFSHHGPVAYFLAAFIYLFSGSSFVKFRIFYSVFLFLYSLGMYQYLKKSIGKKETNFYLFFLIILGIASTYFWGHMLVADNLSAYFISPVIGMVILKVVYKKPFTSLDLIFISVLLSLALLSTLTIIYLVFFTYLFVFYFYLKEEGFKEKAKKSVNFIFIMAVPYLVFFLYLIITMSLWNYIDQSIIFNQKYFIYNYAFSGSKIINPIRYAIIIFHNFYFNFYNLLMQVKDFNFAFPFNITLALSSTALIIYFFLKRNFSLSLFLILCLIFSNARSSPLDSSEKDYQAAVYIMISLFSLCFFLWKCFLELREEREYGNKLILSFLFLVVSIYSFFNIFFIFSRFAEKVHLKYMGKASLIYDRPELAPIINKIIGANDYIWIGPLEFKEYLYAKGKLPSKYHFLVPAMSRSDKIRSEILSDFRNHKPKVIFFDKRYSILGSSPIDYADFFISFLQKNYITLYDYEDRGIKYKSLIPISSRVDLETKMYIDKERKDEIIKKLLSENLVEKYSKVK